MLVMVLFFFQAEDSIRDLTVTGVQTCALPISELDHFELEADLVPRHHGPAELHVVERHEIDDFVRDVLSLEMAHQQHAADLGHRFDDQRSEEHTSELQSQSNLVCRLLLEKKKHLHQLCEIAV